MKIAARILWSGLSREEQLLVAAGAYDQRFPNLKRVCAEAIADDVFADILERHIAVDRSRTDS